jgi:hypothetical protein
MTPVLYRYGQGLLYMQPGRHPLRSFVTLPILRLVRMASCLLGRQSQSALDRQVSTLNNVLLSC